MARSIRRDVDTGYVAHEARVQPTDADRHDSSSPQRYSSVQFPAIRTDGESSAMKLIYSLVIALAVMLPACGEKAPRLPKLAATTSVAFGDRLTYGTEPRKQDIPRCLELIGRPSCAPGGPWLSAKGSRGDGRVDEPNPRS